MPRVRDVEAGKERPLESYQAMKRPGAPEGLAEAILLGLSQGDYERVASQFICAVRSKRLLHAMKHLTLLLSSLFIILHVLTAPAQTLRVELVDELTIGDDEDAPLEYLFTGPRRVTTDSQGNIYVADGKSGEIRVFDADGTFLRKIGEPGEGPGELQEVSAMTIDAQGDLIVADRRAQRITRFSTTGEEVETIPISEDTHVDIWSIDLLGNDRFALRYKVINYERIEGETDQPDPRPNLVHVYDADFSEVQESLAPSSDIYDINEPFERWVARSHRTSVATYGTDRVALVPRFYEGVIYRYDRTKEGWTLTKLQGAEPDFPAYEFFDSDETEDRCSSVIANTMEGKFSARKNSVTRGVFFTSEGRLVHFSWRRVWDVMSGPYIHVEVFKKDGTLISAGYLPEPDELPDEKPLSFRVLWIDADDRFYIRDHRDGFPYLRVARLEYEVADS